MTRVLIAISPDVSGVVSWASRVKHAFLNDDEFRVELILIGKKPKEGFFVQADHHFPDASTAAEILDQKGGILVPNYIWTLYTVAAHAIAKGNPWRVLAYCRADSEDEYYRPLERVAQFASAFVAVSPRCAEQLRNRLPDDGRQIYTLPTCVPRTPSSPTRTRNSGPLEIIYAGRLVQHQKRVFDLVAIMARLEERKIACRLTIAGEGLHADSLQKGLATLGHPVESRILGKLTPYEMEDLWLQGDVFLQCSDFEGTSNSMLEAMAGGCVPVVTATDSGTKGIISDNSNGFLFSPGDHQHAANLLEDLATHRERIGKLSIAAHASTKPYSVEIHKASLRGIYRNLIETPLRTDACLKHGDNLGTRLPTMKLSSSTRNVAKAIIPARVIPMIRRGKEALRHFRHGPPAITPEDTAETLVAGMTTHSEQQYYERAASEVTDMSGKIVDLGCWMGSTTIALAKGASYQENNTQGEEDTVVFAFDIFRWESWMNTFSNQVFGHYEPGDSFLPEARSRVASACQGALLTEADLSSMSWEGGQIRLLLVDVMKDAQLAAQVVREYYPHLSVGALLIHQDYKHYFTPWIHLLQYRLRNCFEFHHETPDGATVGFKVVAEVSLNAAKDAVSGLLDASSDELDQAFKYSIGLVNTPLGKAAVATAHIMHFVHTERLGIARKLLSRYEDLDQPGSGDFVHVRRCVEQGLPNA